MNIKKIKLILAKLGIFRSGSYTWEGDAKDRPMEAIDDNVFNAKESYTTREDLKKVKEKGGKFASLFPVIGIGIVLLILTVVVFSSVAMFTKSGDVMRDNEIENPDITKDITKDEIHTILEKVLDATNTSDEPKETVFARKTDDGTKYYKGKGISSKKVESDLIRKISPLMKDMGFDISSAGEVGGNQQLGGEKYQKENIICDAMSGVYAKNFTNPTSSFSFSCAYIRDRANSYTEAMKIKLDY